MRKIEKVQHQVVTLLEAEGNLFTHQIASMCNPPVSQRVLNMALRQLADDEVIDLKARLGWYLVDGGDDADAA